MPDTSPATRPSADQNMDGQAMGAKGRQTRRRVVDAMTSLMERLPLSDIRVADIARQARISAPTFYLYFEDMTAAALAAVNEQSQSTPDLLRMMDEAWPEGQAYAHAHAFVEAYLAAWASRGAIFRARNLAAEADDERFYAARERAVRPLLDAIAARVARSQASGRIPASLHAHATAGVLLALLERLAAIVGRQTGRAGITPGTTVDAAAHVLAATLEGEVASEATVSRRSGDI